MSARINYIQKLADQDVFKIGEKEYIYRKVTNAEFNQLEKMKLDLRKEGDSEAGSKAIDTIMRTSAKLFFGMTDADYNNAPREDLGYAIEAATYRSIYGKPFLEQNSIPTSASAEKSAELAPQ